MEDNKLYSIWALVVCTIVCSFIFTVYYYNKYDTSIKVQAEMAHIEQDKAFAAAGLVQRIDVTGHTIWTSKP